MSDTKNAVDEQSRSPQYNVVNIKQEKIDAEIEKKINSSRLDSTKRIPLLFTNGCLVSKEEYSDSRSSDDTDNASNEQRMELDEKKVIQPVKSSNEILAELFSVFNAAPPEELLNDENLLKKVKHKKLKKEKRKKRKKSKAADRIKSENRESEESDSGATSSDGKEDSKRNKHKKHKRHKKVDRALDKQKKNEKLCESKNRHNRLKSIVEADEGRRHSKEHPHQSLSKITANTSSKVSKSRRKADDDCDDRVEHRRDAPKHNSFYDGYHESNHRSTKSSSRYRSSSPMTAQSETHNQDKSSSELTQTVNKDQVSDLSLSDEETYINHYNATDNNTRSHTFAKSLSTRCDQHYETNKSYFKDAERKRSRERNRDTYSRRHRGYSPKRSRSRDLGIDKKRLLEIARKNAISMFKRGNLPGCSEMSEEIKDKVLLKMRYGGRTVQDLTEFCKKLSKGEKLNDISDLSSEEDSDVDKSGKPKAFNHPFVIKEREPIVMDIRGSSSKIVKKQPENQTKTITMQFPVSSGQQHRLTEVWVPVVEAKESLAPLPSLPAVTQSTTIFKPSAVKNVFEKSVPVQTEQQPAFTALSNNLTCNVLDESAVAVQTAKPTLTIAPALNEHALSTSFIATTPLSIAAATVDLLPTTHFVPDVPVPSAAPSISVFPAAPTRNFDVSSIISKRLNAMRRLQDNPTDTEALKMMYNSQKEMSSWASSKHLPGQFTGSTGVNTLSVRELNSGPQAWARRDQLTSTLPMTGGMGMHLLKKMGWKPGEGLGREKSGSLQPLLLDVKLDKRGLVSEEENGYQAKQGPSKKRRNASNVLQVQQDMQDKHPVSLLNELTSKRKWTPPLYTLVNEGGPSHNKMFLFSVSINGQTFTPQESSNTKKDAKVKAARVCLQQIGIIP